MLEVVIKHEEERKLLMGRPQKLRYEEQILMMLEYLGEYRTYYHIAVNYGISEGTYYKIIKKIEDILIKSKEFSLPFKWELSNKENGIKVIVIDTTETPIERPKKNKDCIYSGKKKRHTLKTQIVINGETLEILALNFGKGRSHDIRIFKESNLRICDQTIINVDTGYLGISRIHGNSLLHKKKQE